MRFLGGAWSAWLLLWLAWCGVGMYAMSRQAVLPQVRSIMLFMFLAFAMPVFNGRAPFSLTALRGHTAVMEAWKWGLARFGL